MVLFWSLFFVPFFAPFFVFGAKEQRISIKFLSKNALLSAERHPLLHLGPSKVFSPSWLCFILIFLKTLNTKIKTKKKKEKNI
jgi:hypothetical protein